MISKLADLHKVVYKVDEKLQFNSNQTSKLTERGGGGVEVSSMKVESLNEKEEAIKLNSLSNDLNEPDNSMWSLESNVRLLFHSNDFWKDIKESFESQLEISEASLLVKSIDICRQHIDLIPKYEP